MRGVIYEVPEDEMEKLGEVEGVPQGLYVRQTFLVLGEDGELHRADLYRVVDPAGPFTPARSYVEPDGGGRRGAWPRPPLRRDPEEAAQSPEVTLVQRLRP